MDFKQNIKELNKQYLQALKEYYDTRIITQMIYKNFFCGIYGNCQLAFEVCEIGRFSDKYIVKRKLKNINTAIESLRGRAVACIQAIWTLDEVLIGCDKFNERYLRFFETIKQIKKELLTLAKQSISLSDEWAKEYNLPLFKTNQFDITQYHYE